MQSFICFTLSFSLLMLSIIENNLAFADNIVAIVGNKQIMESEINTYTEKIPEPFKHSFKSKALENLIDNQVFSQLAVKEGLDKDKSFISALNRAKDKMLADFYIETKIRSKINITDQAILEYYNQHKSDYSGKSKTHIAHISTPSMQEAIKIKDLLTNGIIFEKLMTDKSDKYGSFTSGDLGWLEGGRLPAAFEEIALSLNIGEISKIFKTNIGFHIIKLLDKKEIPPLSVTEATSQIKEKLFKQELNRIKRLQKNKIYIKIIE